jgi:hypothetical protein
MDIDDLLRETIDAIGDPVDGFGDHTLAGGLTTKRGESGPQRRARHDGGT